MTIATDFTFGHEVPASALFGLAHVDLLGLLRPFVGPKPANPKLDAKRSWKGTGFNLIWRPNFVGEFGPQDFFLQLNFTTEELDFKEISGSGIANRSLFEKTVVLGGAAYTQSVKDSFDQTGQHFEPGVWAHVPATANPEEPETVVRMGSIPHGATINLQGVAFQAPQPPIFEPASITPFQIGNPDDGKTALQHFDNEEDFTKNSPSRTDRNRVARLTPEQLKNPNLLLSQAIANQRITRTTVLRLSSEAPDKSLPTPLPAPDAGGGTANIAFLKGTGGGPNAVAPKLTTTFWIEEVEDTHGKISLQLQYTQRVLLNFKGLSWPHISVATLKAV